MAEKSAKRISEVLRQFRADVGLLQEQKCELLITNPREWVGVYRGVFAFAPTLDQLCDMFGEHSGEAHMAYLDPVPRTYILLKDAYFSIPDESSSARAAAF